MSLDTNAQAVSIAIQTGHCPLVWGPPGVGKTAVMAQIAEALDATKFVTLIASIRDPVDFGGLMIPNERGSVDLAATPWAVEVQALASANPSRLVIVFFDEITTAPPAVQAALLRVLLERVVGEVYLGPNVRFVAAANPPEMAANGSDACAPLANRAVHLDWTIDYNDWCNNVLAGFPAPSVVKLPENWRDEIPAAAGLVSAFIRANPGKLHVMPDDEVSRGRAWPSNRTWTMAIDLWAACEAVHAPVDVRHSLICGAVGAGAGTEFLAWQRALDLPDPEDILASPEKAKLPDRGDKAWAVTGALCAAVLRKEGVDKEGKPLNGQYDARWGAAFTYLDRLASKMGEDMVIPAVRMLVTTEHRPSNMTKALTPNVRSFILRLGRLLDLSTTGLAA